MVNDIANLTPTQDSLGTVGRQVTVGSDIDPPVKAVVCLAPGDITVVPVGNANAATITFVGVFAGFIPPYRVRRVTAATMSVYTIEG